MRAQDKPTLQSCSTTAGPKWYGSSRSEDLTRSLSNGRTGFGCRKYLSLALCVMVASTVWSHTSTVTLAWSPSPDSDVTGYRLFRSLGNAPFEPVKQVTGLSTQATASDTSSTRFYVKALRGTVEAVPSNIVTINPPTVQSAPAITSVQRISTTRVDLGWTMQEPATSQVWRATEGAEWRLMATLTPGNLHWNDTSAHRRRSYSYRVCNNAGCSPASTPTERK